MDKKDELRCSYGWASSKGQQEIEYSVDSIFIDKKDLDAWVDNMPYVTQDITTEFYDKPPLNEEGKLTAEPCILHDYNIGKFGELNLCFRINNFNTEVFRVKVPIDALKEEDLKKLSQVQNGLLKLVIQIWLKSKKQNKFLETIIKKS